MAVTDVVSMYENLLKENNVTDEREKDSKKRWVARLIEKELPCIDIQRPPQMNAPSILRRKEEITTSTQEEYSEAITVEDDALFKVASLIRKEVQEHNSKHIPDFHGSVSLTKEEIPSKLFSFMKLLIAGDKEASGIREKQITRSVISVCNQIMNSCKTERQVAYTPKGTKRSCFKSRNDNQQAVGLGLAIRHHSRKKGVINLLHGFDFVISNRQCLYWETAIANAVLVNMAVNNGYFLPPGIQKSVFIAIHIDNAVFQVETLDGKSTIDTLNISGFQKRLSDDVALPSLQINHTCRKLTLEKNNFHEKVFAREPLLKKFILPEGCTSEAYNRTIVMNPWNDTCLSWLICKALAVVAKSKTCTSTNIELEVVNEEEDKTERRTDSCKILVADAHSMYSSIHEQQDALSCMERLRSDVIPPWSAYHSRLSEPDKFKSFVFRFPLIPGPSRDYSSIYTALMQAQHINVWTESEVNKTVVTLDLGLYYRALQLVQCREDMRDKYVLRLGELHVVFAHLRAIGNFIESSGIDEAWNQSGFFGTVVIRQSITCSNMKRSITGHQITLVVLYKLYFEALLDDNPASFTGPLGSVFELVLSLQTSFEVRDEKASRDSSRKLLEFLQKTKFHEEMDSFENLRRSNKMFQVILIYIRMVERLLTFIYATRSRDWLLHLKAGEALSKDFFSMDRAKYRRLWPVYLANMKGLETSDPALWNLFINGEFCVKKTDIPFTSIAFDHAGEQVIKTLKVDGGIKGIANNNNARLRFFLSSPILAKITADVKGLVNKKATSTTMKHHLDREAEILRQSEMEEKLYRVLSERVDFFNNLEEDNIFNIMTTAMLPVQYHEQLLSCESIGQSSNDKFVNERLSEDSNLSIWAPIKLLRLPTFTVLNKKVKIRVNEKCIELQEHAELFSRCALVASSNREFEMKNVIGGYELSVVPRSLMLAEGSLIPGHEGKSALMNAFAVEIENTESIENTANVIKTIIIDAMVVVQSLGGKVEQIKTCSDIANAFTGKCAALADGYQSVRIAFDRYIDCSLKEATRQKRKGGKGDIQFKIDDNTEVRGALKVFLSNEATKKDLVSYLASKAEAFLKDKNTWTYTITANGISNGSLSNDESNNHEEADTLLVLHAIEASAAILPENKRHLVTIYSPDTDVFIILCHFFDKLAPLTFMKVSAERVLDIHRSVQKIGYERAKALIGLHDFSGCDTTGKFRKKSKLKWWNTFEASPPETVHAFTLLGEAVDLDDKSLSELEAFVCAYCRKYKGANLPEARWHLFKRSPKKIDLLPPTRGAFVTSTYVDDERCRCS